MESKKLIELINQSISVLHDECTGKVFTQHQWRYLLQIERGLKSFIEDIDDLWK